MPNRNGHIVIAIDGTSASGKSTLSERLAKEGGLVRLEYSLIFRSIAHHLFYECGHRPDDEPEPDATRISQAVAYAEQLSRMGWAEIEHIKDNPKLRSIETSRTAPYFSGHPDVLAIADPAFRQMILQSPRAVVAEGRTIGRYVYPEAEVKLFVDAELSVRAARRTDNLRSKGKPITQAEVAADLAQRDHQDQTRPYQPTTCDPAQQYRLDTSTQTIEDTLDEAKAYINATLAAKGLGPVFEG